MNRTMAAKNDKAKREGMKAALAANFSVMSDRYNMAESAVWMMRHRPYIPKVWYK